MIDRKAARLNTLLGRCKPPASIKAQNYMIVIKRLCKHGYAALMNETIRIGSLKYYRGIEDNNRRDDTEGLPSLLMRSPDEGRVVTAQEFNAYSEATGSPIRINSDKLKLNFKGKGTMIFESEINFPVYCTTIIDANRKSNHESTEHLGEHKVRIINPQDFKDMVALNLLKCFQSGSIKLRGSYDSVSSAMRDVIYQDKNPIDDCGRPLNIQNPTMDIGNAFIKPKMYSHENEFRFIWLPYDNPSKMACALPYGFRYIDLRIPGIRSCIQDFSD